MTLILFLSILLDKKGIIMIHPLVLKLIRIYFKVTSRFFPKLATKSAYRLFHMPMLTKRRESEEKLAEKADKWYIQVDEFTTLQAYRWGKKENPLVLIIHGWSSSATGMSLCISTLLKNNYQVVSYDAINHGGSRGSVSDLCSWAKSVSAVVESLGEVECIVAHSLGAASVTLASNLGLESNKIVLISPMNDANAVTDRFGNYFGISLDIIHNMREYTWKLNRGFIDLYGKDWKDILVSDFHVPTLIIHDKNDEEISINDSKILLKTWNWAKFIETKGLGHRKILYSRKVMSDIVDFIKKKS